MSRHIFVGRKKLVCAALGCILLVNAFILARVYVNRSQVIAQLELTERELSLPYNYGFAKEDSSRRLSIRWATPETSPSKFDTDNWRWANRTRLALNNEHFSSFKFPACKEINKQPKRQAWVLLELNGPSFTDYIKQVEQHRQLIYGLQSTIDSGHSEKELAEKRSDADKLLAEAKDESTRLYVIDAASNPELLEVAKQKRAAISAGPLLIVPADIRLSYYHCDNDKKITNEIIVNNLAVESLYVPKDYASGLPLESIRRSTLKFTADIAYGRFDEPWILQLQIQ